jgi:hypothetical protein
MLTQEYAILREFQRKLSSKPNFSKFCDVLKEHNAQVDVVINFENPTSITLTLPEKKIEPLEEPAVEVSLKRKGGSYSPFLTMTLLGLAGEYETITESEQWEELLIRAFLSQIGEQFPL